MDIAFTDCFILNIPFKVSYEHHLAKRQLTDSVILQITTASGRHGYGEAAPRAYVTGETSAQLVADVHRFLPRVLTQFDGSLAGLEQALTQVPEHRLALRCLIEGALLHVMAQENHCSLFELFAVRQRKVLSYTASLTAGDETVFRKMVQMSQALGLRQFKLKIASPAQTNLDRVRLLRNQFGDSCDIRMDGNEIWRFEDAREQVPALLDLGVTCFEQLFHHEDLDASQKAHSRWGKQAEFIADESLTTLQSAENLIANPAFAGANLKISKNGGLINTLRIATRLVEAGKTVRLGCHVGETSALTQAGMVFACLQDSLQGLEGAYGDYLLEEDAFLPSLKFGQYGHFTVDPEHGSGTPCLQWNPRMSAFRRGTA